MKSVFNLLTFVMLIALMTVNSFAVSISQKSLKSHLRWVITAEKRQIKIKKINDKVVIQTLDSEFFSEFSADIAKLSKDSKYHRSFKVIEPQVAGGAYRFELTLKDDSVELFNFYKQDQKNYVLDFWINKDIVATKHSSVRNNPKVIKLAKLPSNKKVKKAKVVKSRSVGKALGKRNKFNILDSETIIASQGGKFHRDFRYGAAFIWDYKALIPELKRDINLKVKAPDYLYSIKDRTMLDNKKEAHLQLIINFYKKAKWGLMTRSINLYEQRYGDDKHKTKLSFMKAVSMFKNNIKESVKASFASKQIINDAEELENIPARDFSKKGIFAAAKNILTNTFESTDNYDMKVAIARYLIQAARDEGDYIQALDYAKNLYVAASTDFDDDMIIFSSRVILNSLANLRQLKKIKEFLGNKAVSRVLPAQIGMAYISYVNLSRGSLAAIIESWEKNKKSLAKPVHSAILFNTAEAYFRLAKYKKAIKLFDTFIVKYNSLNQGSHARLRLALSYDLLDRKPSLVLRLYKDAINRSTDLAVRYEAKLRYVGLRVARNRKLTESAKETLAFLTATNAERRMMTKSHTRLLWLVRLRSFISMKKYEDALAYLSTLPIETIELTYKRVYTGDGAEIVLGVIKDAYLKEKYTRAIKMWEVYKGKYMNRVGKNPYMNFIVADSFLKLGLVKSYERVAGQLKNTNGRVRNFPRWVTEHKVIKTSDYLVELQLNKLLTLKDFSELERFLEANKKNKNINYNFYKGLVSYKLKKYNIAIESYEKLLTRKNLNNKLSPNENISMLESYLEALYQFAAPRKFRKNAAALSNDIRTSGKKKYKILIERADYLYIESLFSERKIDNKTMVRKTNEFIKENKKSNYLSRVIYLNGVALLNNNNTKEGQTVLEALIKDNNVSEYLKGLARSELSTLMIKNKTI